MRRILLFLIAFSLLYLTVGAQAHQVLAQYFKFDLGGATPSVGNSFQVKIMINSAGKDVMGGDAIVVFDNNKLSINSSQNGGFLSSFQDSPIGGMANKYLFSAWEVSEAYAKKTSTDTLFATANLTAKSGGSTTLSFDCTSGTTDSNIWDTTQKDILNCTQSASLAINIGGAATPSPTLRPAPTSTPSATPTKKPTSTPTPRNTPRPTLKRAGSTEVTVGILGIAGFLTVVGILLIL